jgi:hypothetical protein
MFAHIVSNNVQGYVVETIIICDDVDPDTFAPIGEGEIFLTHNGNAYCWVNLTDVNEPHVVKFDWFNPVGELYVSHPIDTEDPGSDFFPSYPVSDFIGIDGNPPSSTTGEWSVKVYVDNNIIGTKYFTIVDYNTIIEKTDSLESQVEEISSSFYQLLTDIESMQDNYEQLLVDYNELSRSYDNITSTYNDQVFDYNKIFNEKKTLQEGYDDLNTDYNELSLEINQLVDDYDTLESDYESIESKISNTNIIMYGSVALAVIFLGAAIYFYTKKK